MTAEYHRVVMLLRSPYAQKPLPYAVKWRLNFGAGEINFPVKRFKKVNRFELRIRVRENSKGRTVRCRFVFQVFNGMTEDLQRSSSLWSEPAANAGRGRRNEMQ
jgi:hypothetical protein